MNLNGLTAYSQNWCVDIMANPIGVATSNAVAHDWVVPYGVQPVTRIFLSGSLGATGSLGVNNSLVTRID
jgi:hypothetical protein